MTNASKGDSRGRETILVLGSTGKTGRRVLEQLTARGYPVRSGSRAADPPFDWDRPVTWEPVLRGVAAVYLSYYPDLAVPGAADTIHAFAELAVTCGVGRLVLLSGRGELEAEHSEQVVQAAGAEWTILRSSWFSQNFSESYLLEPLLAGEVALPVGEVGEPFIDAADIADVAVAALTEPGHGSRLYDLTGPRLLTFAEAVAAIAEATGRELHYLAVTPGQYAAALSAQGVPEATALLLQYLFAEVLDGRNAHVTDGVRRALEREPRDFSDYVRRTAATGIWNVERTPDKAGAR